MGTFRPTKLNEIVGQKKAVQRISISLASARKRGEPFPHMLLSGPPGLGKTTFSSLIGNEMGVKCHVANGGNIRSIKDIVPYLTKLEVNEVLFIDEIHRIPIKVEEFLYPVMEDFKLEFVCNGEVVADSDLKPFTLIGATTIAGNLSQPMRDRFKLVENLKLYSVEELHYLIRGNSQRLNISLDNEAEKFIAGVSRGTPRIANKHLEWIRDCLVSQDKNSADIRYVADALALRGIDKYGMTEEDRKYIQVLKNFNVPTGLTTLAAACNIDKDTIQHVIEPYLIRLGCIAKTPKGRIIK
jgi:Holliday junction DNA helicase RuvB